MSYYYRFLTALFLCLFLLSVKEHESASQSKTCLRFIKMLFIFSSERDAVISREAQFFLESSKIMIKRWSKILLNQNTPLINLHCIWSAFSLRSNRDSDYRERNRKKKKNHAKIFNACLTEISHCFHYLNYVWVKRIFKQWYVSATFFQSKFISYFG